MRLHLLGIPHTVTTKDFAHCAFTQKVYKFSRMMVPLGYEVLLDDFFHHGGIHHWITFGDFTHHFTCNFGGYLCGNSDFLGRYWGFGYNDFGDFATFGFDDTNAFHLMLAIGGRKGFVFGDDIHGGSCNEVAVHTDNSSIHQLVVGKGLLLGCELPQLGAESVNGCF